SVVVFAFENRTWSDVGTGFGPEMSYLHVLGERCSWFTDWTESDTSQNSLAQYVGQVTGAPQPGTVNDCSPSATCSTTADNIFRQARRAGLSAINYVEGATDSCSSDGNAVKHVPAAYLWGADDRAQRCPTSRGRGLRRNARGVGVHARTPLPRARVQRTRHALQRERVEAITTPPKGPASWREPVRLVRVRVGRGDDGAAVRGE